MKTYTGPIILIGLGVYFLLQQFEILSFHFRDLITYGFILIGILMLVNSFDNLEKKGLLGGVFFISLGALMSFMRFNYMYQSEQFGMGAFLISLALGNLVFYAALSRNINLVWGIIYVAAGAVFMAMDFGLLYSWEVLDQVAVYWPLGLIAVGLVIIYNAYRKRDSVSVN